MCQFNQNLYMNSEKLDSMETEEFTFKAANICRMRKNYNPPVHSDTI